ncbi:hypothetical protein EVA_02592 [gut metagenome]|uniref:Uncharacterized protein n=1 Tax=gut metagenome TaxID=749906 RepID=J9GMP5_9ZZZZ
MIRKPRPEWNFQDGACDLKKICYNDSYKGAVPLGSVQSLFAREMQTPAIN